MLDATRGEFNAAWSGCFEYDFTDIPGLDPLLSAIRSGSFAMLEAIR